MQHGIGCIVIVGDDDKIAGIVSERDLMRAIGQGGPKVLKEPVSDFMTKTVIKPPEADTVMPVVERDRLIGLVSIIQISEIEMEAAATREYTA